MYTYVYICIYLSAYNTPDSRWATAIFILILAAATLAVKATEADAAIASADYMYMYVYIYMYIHVHICIYIHVYIYIYMCICTNSIYVYICIHRDIWIITYVCILVCCCGNGGKRHDCGLGVFKMSKEAYIYENMCIYTYIYVYVYIYIYIYIIYIYVYIHINTHMYMYILCGDQGSVWRKNQIYAKRDNWNRDSPRSCKSSMAVSTSKATSRKSPKSTSLDFWAFRGTISNWDFGLIWIRTTEFEFFDFRKTQIRKTQIRKTQKWISGV